MYSKEIILHYYSSTNKIRIKVVIILFTTKSYLKRHINKCALHTIFILNLRV
jgi:hypothetical protein